jgi:nucleotide-binding universal stress UspA family protein
MVRKPPGGQCPGLAATVLEPSSARDHGTDRTDAVGRLLEEDWALPLAKQGVDRELCVLNGDARSMLAQFASEGDIDAVVVGTRGSGGFRGLGLGGVAHYLAHHVRCTLIAVPEAGGPLRGGTIVVGADGSTANEPALRWAALTANRVDGKAVALFVYPPQADVMTHTAATWHYHGEDKVRAAVEKASVDTPPMEVVLAGGNPVEELVRAGSDLDAGLIVVGRRGWGSVGGLVLGRIPAQLLHHAGRPVAVVPH